MLSRRFAPLFWCQFFAAFNDNFLKTSLVFILLFARDGRGSDALITLASAIFIAPYFFLSALGGQLADRYDKARVAQMIKLAEILIVAIAAVGAPGTAGRPPRGTAVKILDEAWRELGEGESGHIFVGGELLFDGYTGGGDKVRHGSLMSTGDVGHFDAAGRLFVDGRDDDMIVSGGENVFPSEVEDLLAGLPGIREVAVIGVVDEEFGQRLQAFAVLDDGAVLSERELQEHVKLNLARYKVPREVVFLDELPRNATGKVLRRELVAQATDRQRVPED